MKLTADKFTTEYKIPGPPSMFWSGWWTFVQPLCQRPSPCSSPESVGCPFLWTPNEHTKTYLWEFWIGDLPSGRGKQGIYLCLEDPVSLWFKRLDLIMTFYTEAKCRSLARSKRDQGRIQIAIFALKIFSLKPEGI